MTQTEQTLKNILYEIDIKLSQNGTVLAVFDLDSTLFDVRPRILKIFKEFSELPEMISKYPVATQKLRGLKNLSHSYYIRDYIQEIGLQNESPQFFKEIYEYWRFRFFHNDYVMHDTPVPGAVDFVQKLLDRGVFISYLTGRDIPRMEFGTIESLKKWEFPLQPPQAELALKPHSSLEDSQFKRDYLLNVRSKTNHDIWFFENEPVNLQVVLRDCPHVSCVFFDSVHMGKAEEPRHLPTIQSFHISTEG